MPVLGLGREQRWGLVGVLGSGVLGSAVLWVVQGLEARQTEGALGSGRFGVLGPAAHCLGSRYRLSPIWPPTLLQAVAVTHGVHWPPTAPMAPVTVTVAQEPVPAGPTSWARAVIAVHPTSGAWGGQGAVSPVAATPHMPCTLPVTQ